MVKLTTPEKAIALAALNRSPYRERMAGPIGMLKSNIAIELVPDTVKLLREAIETGIASGIFRKADLPEIKDFVARKLIIGQRCNGPAIRGIKR
jgi:hypothetical protein